MIHFVVSDFNPWAWMDYLSMSSIGTEHHWRYIIRKICGYTVPDGRQALFMKVEYIYQDRSEDCQPKIRPAYHQVDNKVVGCGHIFSTEVALKN